MPDEDATIRDNLTQPGTTAPTDRESSSEGAAPKAGIVDFPPTRWSLVLQAATGDDTGALQAMAELCEHYRPAIQSYFRMKCRDPHTAEDLSGAFVLHLLEKNRLRKFQVRENVRFRNYLSRALKYFLCDHPPTAPPNDPEELAEAAGETPEMDKHIDAQWALTTHQRAMAALEENYRRHGKVARLERLGPFILEDPEGDAYPRAASDLGLTVNALYQAVFRLRHDYYERFRAEVAQTVRQCKEELDAETRYLMALVPAALGESGPG